jgi:hypothetical protein
MPLSESLEAQARRETASIVCPTCQREKKSGHALCVRCYYLLSDDLKRDLRQLRGLDYAVALDEAKDFVRQMG